MLKRHMPVWMRSKAIFLSGLCILVGLGVLAGVQGTHAVQQADATVTLSGTLFVPATITIQPGGTVEWVKTGGLHNVQAQDGSFKSGDPTTDPFTFSHTFDAPGEYKYLCMVHGESGMRGTIVVAATDAAHIYLPLIIQ
jgi:plastocyanin